MGSRRRGQRRRDGDLRCEDGDPTGTREKTAALFELSAKSPSGPERISQADGFIEYGKAKTMIPVFQPQYREEDGSIPTRVEYQFTAKHSHSDLLKDDKAIRIVDHMAGQVIDTHILQDITFALDKSFVRTQEVAPIKEMFQRITVWQEDHPSAKMAVFGHPMPWAMNRTTRTFRKSAPKPSMPC